MNVFISLTVDERIEVTSENDSQRTAKVVSRLLELASRNLVKYNGWGKDHPHDIDNPEDSGETIGATQTHIYVRIALDEANVTVDETQRLAYTDTIHALSFQPSVIVSDYEREQDGLTQTYIEIKVGELNTDMA